MTVAVRRLPGLLGGHVPPAGQESQEEEGRLGAQEYGQVGGGREAYGIGKLFYGITLISFGLQHWCAITLGG